MIGCLSEISSFKVQLQKLYNTVLDLPSPLEELREAQKFWVTESFLLFEKQQLSCEGKQAENAICDSSTSSPAGGERGGGKGLPQSHQPLLGFINLELA